MTRPTAKILTVYDVVLLVFLSYMLFRLWPDAAWNPASILGMQLSADVRIMLIVVLAGALGTITRNTFFFTTNIGWGQEYESWDLYYIILPFVGGTLALIVYFALRGGVLGPSGQASDINVFGVATYAALVGMFTYEAIQKLREVFLTLFKTTS